MHDIFHCTEFHEMVELRCSIFIKILQIYLGIDMVIGFSVFIGIMLEYR